MRDFMVLVEAYAGTAPAPDSALEPVAAPLCEAAPMGPAAHAAWLVESRDLIFKLRAHSETGPDDERALGIELGFARAADMIENLLRRHEKA